MSQAKIFLSEDTIANAGLANIMMQCAKTIMRTDGGRDYMNGSNLTVQQTTSMADLMRVVAGRLAPSST